MSTVGFTPIYKILRGGVDITDNFNDRAIQLSVESFSGDGDGSDIFQITLDDRDWLIASPQIGESLQIYLGYAEVGMSYMGLFEISEVTYSFVPKSIMLTGMSAGMSSAMKSPVIKDFDNKTVGEILRHFAAQVGIGLAISPELANRRLPFKNVVGISGWHLVHELERLFGAVAKIENGKLIFIPRDQGASFTGELLPTLVLNPWHLADGQVRHTQRADFTDVKASWWDKDNHETIWESAPTGIYMKTPTPFTMNKRFNSQEQAKQAIQSTIGILRRSKGECRFTLSKGDPWIKAQMPVIVAKMRDGINGSYVIDSVKHSYFKSTGITTNIVATPPSNGNDFGENLGDSETFSPIGGDPAPPTLKSMDSSLAP